MDTYERYYDFRIGDENAGYYVITSQPGRLTMLARFMMDGEEHENTFELQHDGERVTAYRSGSGEWQSMEKYTHEQYPTSAYPLLLEKVEERFVYQSINEGTGEVEGDTLLERTGDTITEKKGCGTMRIFRMQDGIPVEIDWGGPVSTLCDSPDRARQGSPFELRKS